MAANNYEDGGAINDSAYDQDPDASDTQQVLEQPGDQAIPTQPQMFGGADSYMGGPGKSPMMQPHQALRNTVHAAGNAVHAAGNAAQAIIAYLHGDGAASPEQVKQVEQSVDPQGTMDPNQKTVAGIQAAADQGGPDAGAAFIQAHRQMYNAKAGFARRALNGGQAKGPDLNAAVNAANQAYYHVPNGQGVQFASTGNGVTATVNGKHFQLSPQQFDQWLDVGGKGQFDNVYENGAEKVLAGLRQPQQEPQGAIPEQQDPNAPYSAPGSVARPTVSTGEPGSAPVGADPSRGRSQTFNNDAGAGYDSDLVARAKGMFPGVNNPQRARWLAQQQEARDTAEAAGQRTLGVEQAKGQTQRDIWGTRTASNEKIADTRAKAYERNGDAKAEAAKFTAAVKMAIANNLMDSKAADRAQRVTTAKIMAGQVTPADEAQINSLYKAVGNAPQASVPQQGAAPGAGAQANTRVIGNVTYTKHADGKWYK